VGFFVCLGEWERGSKPRDAGRLREFGEHVSPPQARGGPRGTTPGDSRRLHQTNEKACPQGWAFFAYYRVFMGILADYGESQFCQRPAQTSGY
jgi:hypothetical protein